MNKGEKRTRGRSRSKEPIAKKDVKQRGSSTEGRPEKRRTKPRPREIIHGKEAKRGVSRTRQKKDVGKEVAVVEPSPVKDLVLKLIEKQSQQEAVIKSLIEEMTDFMDRAQKPSPTLAPHIEEEDEVKPTDSITHPSSPSPSPSPQKDAYPMPMQPYILPPHSFPPPPHGEQPLPPPGAAPWGPLYYVCPFPYGYQPGHHDPQAPGVMQYPPERPVHNDPASRRLHFEKEGASPGGEALL